MLRGGDPEEGRRPQWGWNPGTRKALRGGRAGDGEFCGTEQPDPAAPRLCPAEQRRGAGPLSCPTLTADPGPARPLTRTSSAATASVQRSASQPGTSRAEQPGAPAPSPPPRAGPEPLRPRGRRGEGRGLQTPPRCHCAPDPQGLGKTAVSSGSAQLSGVFRVLAAGGERTANEEKVGG